MSLLEQLASPEVIAALQKAGSGAPPPSAPAGLPDLNDSEALMRFLDSGAAFDPQNRWGIPEPAQVTPQLESEPTGFRGVLERFGRSLAQSPLPTPHPGRGGFDQIMSGLASGFATGYGDAVGSKIDARDERNKQARARAALQNARNIAATDAARGDRRSLFVDTGKSLRAEKRAAAQLEKERVLPVRIGGRVFNMTRKEYNDYLDTLQRGSSGSSREYLSPAQQIELKRIDAVYESATKPLFDERERLVSKLNDSFPPAEAQAKAMNARLEEIDQQLAAAAQARATALTTLGQAAPGGSGGASGTGPAAAGGGRGDGTPAGPEDAAAFAEQVVSKWLAGGASPKQFAAALPGAQSELDRYGVSADWLAAQYAKRYAQKRAGAPAAAGARAPTPKAGRTQRAGEQATKIRARILQLEQRKREITGKDLDSVDRRAMLQQQIDRNRNQLEALSSVR